MPGLGITNLDRGVKSSNPGMVFLILLRKQRAKRAFFRSDLEVVHIFAFIIDIPWG